MSLRTRLLLIIGLALAVLWSGAAIWMLRDLDRGMQRTLDERLAMSARMVSGLLSQASLSAGASSISASGSLIVPGSRSMACQIRSLRGEIIATTRNPGQPPLPAAAPGYRTMFIDGQRWRTYTLHAEYFDITTADRLDERSLLRRRIALAAGIPFLIACLGGLFALWIGVGRALAPVRNLQSELANRRPDAIEAVPTRGLPVELRPLVTSLNGLLGRIAQSIQRERSFTSDAAHELRTPLTGIDTHLQVARLTTGDAASRALDDAAAGVARMRTTLDQLLMLARVEGQASFDYGERINGQEAVDRAMTAAGGDLQQRVRRSGAAGTSILNVPPAMAVVALRNLIDNALKHSPAQRPIEIELEERQDAATVRVRDHGSGMSDSELESATQRFWRREHTGQGIGLGLTLVQAVAERFGGTLVLRRHTEGGLVAELTLPRLP